MSISRNLFVLTPKNHSLGIYKLLFSSLFLLLSVYLFYTHILVVALSNYPINFFDESLRLLALDYFHQGLIPYRQFGIVYAPGLMLLFGKIFAVHAYETLNLLLALITIGICIVGGALLFSLSHSRDKLWWGLGFYSLFNVIALEDRLNLIALLSIFVFCVASFILQPTRFKYFILFIIPVVFVFFRWDWMVGLCGLQCLAFLIWAYLTRHDPGRPPFMWDMLKLLALEILGILVGFGLLFYYLYHQHALREGFDFIFNIPSHVILPYRVTPFPKFKFFRPNSLFYIDVLVMAIGVARLFRELKSSQSFQSKFLWVTVTLLPIALLPYATGRADPGHAVPLTYLIGVAWITLFVTENLGKSSICVMVLLLTPFCKTWVEPINPVPRMTHEFSASLSALNENCNQAIQGLNYASLFVGRISYDRYYYSSPNLYLINPNVPPATAFISDEPGLQNSCYYGGLIANELKHAKKPMLAFLEMGSQAPEKNKTQNMKSCLRIEDALNKIPYKTIGSCMTNRKNFMIRLYG